MTEVSKGFIELLTLGTNAQDSSSLKRKRR